MTSTINRFTLLNVEDDDEIQAPPAPVKAGAKAVTTPAKAAVPAKASAPASVPQKGTSKPSTATSAPAAAPRPPREQPRADRRERSEPSQSAPVAPENGVNGELSKGSREPKRGSGGTRGPHAPRFAGDRQYDRQTNAPRPGEKKLTNGPGNWGNPKDESPNSELVPPVALDVEAGTPTSTTDEIVETKGPIKQEKDKEDAAMTLGEFKAQKQRANIDLPLARVAGEGSDASLWSNTTPMVKDDVDFFAGKGVTKKQKTKERKVVETLTVETPVYEGANRTRGRPQNQRQEQKRAEIVLPKITDQTAFPTLKA